MLTETLVDQCPVWLLYGSTVLLLLAGSEIGFRLGRWRRAHMSEGRTTIPAVVLVLVFSAVIVLIVDLERPRQQLFKVSQEPMQDAARRIQSPQP